MTDDSGSMPARYHALRSMLLCALLVAAPAPLAAQVTDAHCAPGEGKRVFFGDLHVHTAFSLDAYVASATRTPEDAYAFARGEADVLPDGTQVRIDRPLDFLAVTDHGEYFGVAQRCGQLRDDDAYCTDLNDAAANDGVRAFREFFLPALMANEPICPLGPEQCAVDEVDLWKRVQRAAHDAYVPCEFTTFVGNEWSLSPNNLHWHRNVIFRGTTVTERALSIMNAPTPQDLYRALDAGCRAEDGCAALAIPHNTNLGMGGSFAFDADDAATRRLRRRYERLAEIFQHKGQSECYTRGPFTDEACAFEIALPALPGQSVTAPTPLFSDAEHEQIAGGYLRDALAAGLTMRAGDEAEPAPGNPFRVGFIGSTDSHGARPGYVQEREWAGTFANLDATPAAKQRLINFNPGGLAAVWAEENTREAIFDALARRETYATSGPRIGLRFLQSFDDVDLCADPEAAQAVMGGHLSPRAAGADGATPRFAVQVRMDTTPISGIDIVRLRHRDGAVDQHVERFESDGRAEWCVQWTDESFEVGVPALWYARVLEQPTARWSRQLGDERTIAERAWSSPIWSLPER